MTDFPDISPEGVLQFLKDRENGCREQARVIPNSPNRETMENWASMFHTASCIVAKSMHQPQLEEALGLEGES